MFEFEKDNEQLHLVVKQGKFPDQFVFVTLVRSVKCTRACLWKHHRCSGLQRPLTTADASSYIYPICSKNFQHQSPTICVVEIVDIFKYLCNA